MKQIATILGKLLVIAQNTRTWLKVLVMIVVAGGMFTIGAIAFSQSKAKPCEDCNPSKLQVQQLINALIEVRTGIKEMAAQTNYQMDETEIKFMFASYDTIPKKKKKLTQNEIKAAKMLTKLDSLILDAQRKQQQIKQ